MLVLDTSAAMAWYLPEERTPATDAVLDLVTNEGAIVPLHWRIETGNALLVAARRGRISPQIRSRALARLGDLQLTTDDQTLDHAWAASLALADAYQLTLYDACYLELAQRRALPLASLDKELREAARALGLELLGV
jgi:predicted nucleic acid-binding protein